MTKVVGVFQCGMVRFILRCFLLFSLSGIPVSAMADDQVTNIRWYRVADDRVVVWYDLVWDSPVDTALEIVPASGAPFRPGTVTGDIGPRIVPGPSKRVIWTIVPGEAAPSPNTIVRIVPGALPSTPTTVSPTAVPRSSTEIVVPVPTSAGVMDVGRLLAAQSIQSLIKMDGVLNEVIWEEALPATGFFQSEPDEAAPATERTEVRILYDATNLYVGVICYDADPDRIIHNELRVDGALRDDDNFSMVIDTFNDRRGGFYFCVNPNGARLDGKITKSGGNAASNRRHSSRSGSAPGGSRSALVNDDWNGLWDASARVTPEGWSAEMVIPFKTLRFPGGESMDWGINFMRDIKRKKEEALWCSWMRDDGIFQLSKAGQLLKIQNVNRGGLTEVKPYVLGSADKEHDSSRSNDIKYGFDLKRPVGTNFTLDLTTNTDFAQVEADQTRINLTQYNLYYPEKREFFLEGAEIFKFGTTYTTPTYTRRIGLTEDGDPIPILGGAKLTGKSNGWSVGFMNMTTDHQDSVAAANYTMLRVKRDVLERSYVGFYLTGKRDADKHANTSWGGDFAYNTDSFMGDRNLSMEGYVADNYTEGLEDDSMSYRLNITYPNDLVNLYASHQMIGENYLPETGFIRRNAVNQTFLTATISPRPNIPGIRKLIFSPGNFYYVTDRHNHLESRRFDLTVFGFETTSDEKLSIKLNNTYEYLDDDFEFFEGAIIGPDTYSWRAWETEFETSRSRPLSLKLTAETGGFYSGEINTLQAGVTGKFGPHLSITPDMAINDFTVGGKKYHAREYSMRVETNLSTRVSAATLVQWNNEEDIANLNFRLRIIPQIGSDIYLVYNHLWDTTREYATEYQAAVAKIAWLFTF